ncbi:MAG: sulfotransferase domain-containing protein [Anaerolineae bacterium]|nr:sulfotransferase domain-containing protein [Anaerolineae bacterium]
MKSKNGLAKLLIHLNFHLNLHLNSKRKKPKEVIWVVGDGRSGTTWISNLINSRKQYRYMFEPFHPILVPWMKKFMKFQYLRPNNTSKYFLGRGRVVFSGQLQHPRINRHNQYESHHGLLIKDIHAHLFINWVDVQFPHVKKVMILRHPCAVALSKMRLKRWNWPRDPEIFFSQPELCQDHLSGFEHVTERVASMFERYVLTWSILHYVPLQQLNNQQIHLVFYEALCTNPEHELSRLFSYLGEPTELGPELKAMLKTPSRTSRGHSAIITGADLIDGWRKELTREEIKRALDILVVFDLDRIYNDMLLPNIEQAERLLGQGVEAA